METNTDILNELASLSPLIAAMNKVNVFTVPNGYFESVPYTVLTCLHEEHSILSLPGNEGPVDVPEGYFDQLANTVLNKIKGMETATDETRNLSPLLYDLQNKNVFEIPSGYFESLYSTIADKMKTVTVKEELKGISPLLYSIESKNIFEVTDSYFTDLPAIILKKVQPQTGKIVGMRHVFLKYAVAAMITGVTALGVYKYIEKPTADKTMIENTNAVAALDNSIEKGKSMNDKQFNEAMENLSEADIAKYLESNGDIADVSVLRNNLEEKSLPSQEDYLTDETTLENYLKEIDKTTLNN